jgi:hypothetical protein
MAGEYGHVSCADSASLPGNLLIDARQANVETVGETTVAPLPNLCAPGGDCNIACMSVLLLGE